MTPPPLAQLLREPPLDLDALRRLEDETVAAILRDLAEEPARLAAMLETLQRQEEETLAALTAELETDALEELTPPPTREGERDGSDNVPNRTREAGTGARAKR